MKTLKHRGKTYEVVDVWVLGDSVKNLNIIAVMKDGGLMDIVTFTASYYPNGDVTTEFAQQFMTKRTARILYEC